MSDRTFIYDPECDMPRSVQERHWGIIERAIACFQERDRVAGDDLGLAADHHDIGEMFLADASSLTAEWSAS